MGARDCPKLTWRRRGAENLGHDRARAAPRAETVKDRAEGVDGALSMDLPATKQGNDRQPKARGKHQGAIPMLD